MTDSQSLALSAASAAAAASLDLLEHARTDGNADELALTDVVENACDAAKMAIEAAYGDNFGDDIGQVYGALCKFLEGWAG